MHRIKAPVLGIYGENDERIDATLPRWWPQMQSAGKTFTHEVYPGHRPRLPQARPPGLRRPAGRARVEADPRVLPRPARQVRRADRGGAARAALRGGALAARSPGTPRPLAAQADSTPPAARRPPATTSPWSPATPARTCSAKCRPAGGSARSSRSRCGSTPRFRVVRVLVDGKPNTRLSRTMYARQGSEVVVPHEKAPGDTLTTRVRYHGIPRGGLRVGPDRAGARALAGETAGRARAALAAGARRVTRRRGSTVAWNVQASEGQRVVANGTLVRVDTLAYGHTTWHYRLDAPVPLDGAGRGGGQLRGDDAAARRPAGDPCAPVTLWTAPDDSAAAAAGAFRRAGEMVDFLSGCLGPVSVSRAWRTWPRRSPPAGRPGASVVLYDEAPGARGRRRRGRGGARDRRAVAGQRRERGAARRTAPSAAAAVVPGAPLDRGRARRRPDRRDADARTSTRSARLHQTGRRLRLLPRPPALRRGQPQRDRPAGRPRAGHVGGGGRSRSTGASRRRVGASDARVAPVGRAARGRRPCSPSPAAAARCPPLRGQMEVGRDAYAIFVGGGGRGRRRSLRRAHRRRSGRADHLQPASARCGRRSRRTARWWRSCGDVASGLDAGQRVGDEPADGAASASSSCREEPARRGEVGWSRRRPVAGGAPRAPASTGRAPRRRARRREPVPPPSAPPPNRAWPCCSGDPVFARVVPCAEPGALCVAVRHGRARPPGARRARTPPGGATTRSRTSRPAAGSRSARSDPAGRGCSVGQPPRRRGADGVRGNDGQSSGDYAGAAPWPVWAPIPSKAIKRAVCRTLTVRARLGARRSADPSLAALGIAAFVPIAVRRPALPSYLAAIASHAASSAIATGGASGVHSRAPTRSATNATSASQTSVHSSAGPGADRRRRTCRRPPRAAARRGTRARPRGSSRRGAARPGGGAASGSGRRRARPSPAAAGRSAAAGSARPSPSAALPHDGRAPALGPAEDLVEQMLLAAEMAIDRAFGHARPRGDGRRGGGPEPDGGIQLECCTKQPLAGGLTVAAHRLGGSHVARIPRGDR